MEVFLIALAAVITLGFFLGWFVESILDRLRRRRIERAFMMVPIPPALPHALAEHWMQVPLFAQPLDDQGNPFCANLECGLPLENPYHFIEMAAPGGAIITRIFCPDCQARLMEERRAIFCGQ